MQPFQAQARTLKLLAHPTRLRLLHALRNDEECVCHLTVLLKQRQAYISQQLMCLRQAGVITDRKEGARVYYRVCNERVFEILDATLALTGKSPATAEPKKLATCPCPKCNMPIREQVK